MEANPAKLLQNYVFTSFIQRSKQQGVAFGHRQSLKQAWFIRGIREIKIHVHAKRQTSDSSWEFLRIENKQIKTVQNNSYG